MRSTKAIINKVLLAAVVLINLTQLLAQEANFIKNEGQVFNQNGEFNDNVKYVLSLKSYNVSFYSDHFSYELFSQNKEDSNLLNVERIELWFDEPNTALKINPSVKIKEVVNVFKNGKSFTDIPSYKEITYKNVWDGVDIEFLIHNNQIKYNYVISNQKTKSISLINSPHQFTS